MGKFHLIPRAGAGSGAGAAPAVKTQWRLGSCLPHFAYLTANEMAQKMKLFGPRQLLFDAFLAGSLLR